MRNVIVYQELIFIVLLSSVKQMSWIDWELSITGNIFSAGFLIEISLYCSLLVTFLLVHMIDIFSGILFLKASVLERNMAKNIKSSGKHEAKN